LRSDLKGADLIFALLTVYNSCIVGKLEPMDWILKFGHETKLAFFISFNVLNKCVETHIEKYTSANSYEWGREFGSYN
jgi:hypothetical protein